MYTGSDRVTDTDFEVQYRFLSVEANLKIVSAVESNVLWDKWVFFWKELIVLANQPDKKEFDKVESLHAWALGLEPKCVWLPFPPAVPVENKAAPPAEEAPAAAATGEGGQGGPEGAAAPAWDVPANTLALARTPEK